MLFFLSTIISLQVISQNVGINTNTPNASALLHIETGAMW